MWEDHHVDKQHNRRNGRYIAESPAAAVPSVKYAENQKFPAKATVDKAFLPTWLQGTLNTVLY